MGEVQRIEQTRRQNIILENRKKLTVSGVEEVVGFDEKYVDMRTSEGELLIQGEELRVEKLSVETGDLTVLGRIEALSYTETPEKKTFFARIFGE